MFVEVRGTNVAEMSAADIKRLIGIQRPVHMVFDRYLPASEIKARRQVAVISDPDDGLTNFHV